VDEDMSSYAGPTPWCNWVIHNKVMAGGYPATMDDASNDELLLMLMRDCGVDCFVCLQSEVSVIAYSYRCSPHHSPPKYHTKPIYLEMVQRGRTKRAHSLPQRHPPKASRYAL